MTLRVTKLDNGFHILTYSMAGAESVAINLIAKVGSRCESKEENGISHFLEHMAFKGTKSRSARKIAEEFDAIGGHFNAYTSKEQTVYYAKVLPENLSSAMDIISDIVQNSLFDQEDIAKEYQVICQEIAQTIDSPDDLAYEKLSEAAFSNQALGRSILGTPETIAGFTTDDFKKYISSHYHGENMFLSAAGKVDHDKIVEMAKRMFDFEKGISNASIFDPAEYKGGVSLISKDLEQSNLLIGFGGISYKEITSSYHMQLLSIILGGGISSRLFQHIREDLGLAYSVGSFNSSYADTGLFSVYAATSHENLKKTTLALVEQMQMICDNVTEEELLRAKNQIRSIVMMSEEKTAYKSEEIGRYFSIFGRYDGPEVFLDIINKATVNDVTSIAKKIFSTKPTLSVVGKDASVVDYNDIRV
ncbi:MAG: insulinase family protein [Rickettsiaceae bacterium]|nr:insulinase family protein [Rickettsiaceae bacterium]